ncbi:MAG: hypothetical protein H6625_06380 [Bdellovibrionaceae bacterium]|nr:hypothetical protein [Pseudobdellovibrionaceae bacterium]
MKRNSLRRTYFYTLGTVIFSLLLTVGCGKDKNNGVVGRGTTPIPPPPVTGPNSNNGYYTAQNSWGGRLTIIEHKTYERFLTDHNICNFPGMIYGFGTWDCSNYNALYVSLHLQSLTVPTQGLAQIWNYYNNAYAVLPPSVLTGEFAPIDQNTGIQIYRRGYDGTASYNAIFRYSVYGDLKKDKSLSMELWYRQVKFAIATISPE